MAERAGGPEPEPDRQSSPPSAQPRDGAAAGPAPEPAGPRPHAAQEPGSADAAARIAELEDQRLRALADLENLRKKCASQVSQVRADTQAQVAEQWLPVVDNLERALAHAQADPRSIIEGITAVRDQAMGVLTQLGFPRREDLGETFDPARHEAVASRDASGAPDGSVVEVVRPGYGEGDRQLRPAQVIVAKAD
jgi:molecular chaperone GrpE